MNEEGVQTLRSQVKGIGANLSAIIERSKAAERENKQLRHKVDSLSKTQQQHNHQNQQRQNKARPIRVSTGTQTAQPPPAPPERRRAEAQERRASLNGQHPRLPDMLDGRRKGLCGALPDNDEYDEGEGDREMEGVAAGAARAAWHVLVRHALRPTRWPLTRLVMVRVACAPSDRAVGLGLFVGDFMVRAHR